MMKRFVLPTSVVAALFVAACETVPNNTATSQLDVAPETAMYKRAIVMQSAPTGVPDLAGAKELLEKAAEAGSADAMDRLGDMYQLGEAGVSRNAQEALSWYRREGELSTSRPGEGAWGLVKTGLAYEMGMAGLEKSSLDADEWYKKAAETARIGASRKVPSAMTAMSYLLAFGKGVKEDDVQAWNWAIKAVEVDEARARSLMAELYAKGQGVKVNDEEAFKNSLRAAQLGVIDQMVQVGLGFISGEGAPVDSPAALEWMQKAIERGSSRAMREYGRLYNEGKGVPRNDETARAWLQKAIDLKDPKALGYMGRLVQARSPGDAANWFREGAAAGDAGSMYSLAMVYLDPTGTSLAKDPAAAVQLLRAAAELDYGKAMTRMGQLSEEGVGVPQSLGTAIGWYRRASTVEDPEGMYRLGVMLAGQQLFLVPNVPTGYPESKTWLTKAAEAGYGPAMTLLGRIYSNGIGRNNLDRDPVLGARWLERAARAGDADAMVEYGELVVEGKYASRDFRAAMEWFNRAQQAGNTYALIALGGMYEKGQGVEIDYNRAMQYYQEADRRGNPAAKAAIGKMYQDGLGVERNAQRAIALFTEGMAMNDVSAVEALAQTYEFGKGVLIDNDKTRTYYRRAAELGSEDAEQWLSWHPETPVPGAQRGGAGRGLPEPILQPGVQLPGRGGLPPR